ncbi:MAG: bacitracin ABC transporter ATP-binding protein [Marinilabiliales bacterium]|nr:MAG: bacitracin ABC transporter ATP-binding protein [Marinilabiliales bacterium]
MPENTIVKIRGLCKSFDGIIALNNLDMEVKKGDIYGFLGPNGSGKSTTIKALLTLVKPEMGDIEVFGQDLNINAKSILKRIGSIIEKPGFYERISAMNNLKLLAKYSDIKITEKELIEIFDTVGLSDRKESKVGSYSHGMKQRLGFAQAIMHKPELLILDEPFGGLDPKGSRDMRKLILKLNKEKGTTIVLSSHHIDEIENIANRMIIINKGSSVCEGSVKEIVENNKMSIIIIVDEPAEALKKLKASRLPIENISLVSNVIKLNCSHDAIPFINQYLQLSGFKIYEIRKEKALENYYLTFT